MFYHFRQNNSGGSFRIDPDGGISVNVIIEADGTEDANQRAEDIGIYFNGCSTGWDCSCCGDRWYPVSEHDASGVPCLYDDPIHAEGATVGSNWAAPSPEGFIHYMDGTKEALWVGAVATPNGPLWGRRAAVVTPWPLEEAELITMALDKGPTRAIAA